MNGPCPQRVLAAAISLGALWGSFGCIRIPTDGNELTIATTWPDSEQAEIEAGFSRWLAVGQALEPAAAAAARIEWIRLVPGENPAPALTQRLGPLDLRDRTVDVLAGGTAASYARLARADQFVPIDRSGSPSWCVSRRVPIRMAIHTHGGAPVEGTSPAASADPKASTAREGGVTFDDPRHDPIALAWAKGELAAGDWANGYARLVHAAGNPRRPGRQPGAGLAAVERGEATATPAPADSGKVQQRGIALVATSAAAEWIEGVAIVRGGSNGALAQLFLRFLAERGRAEPAPAGLGEDGDEDALVADLLGSTLVDAQDELWEAWAVLERTGHPVDAERSMTAAPPWPPASIVKLVERDRSGALLQTLAAEIVPDATLRAWLMRSWLAPTRPIDGPLLRELSGAVDGRLVREPRLRAWLRAEWTAWARQRYRRVARKAGGWTP